MSEGTSGGPAVSLEGTIQQEEQKRDNVIDIITLKQNKANRRSLGEKLTGLFHRSYKGERVTIEEQAKGLEKSDPEIEKLGINTSFVPKAFQQGYVALYNQFSSTDRRFQNKRKILEAYVNNMGTETKKYESKTEQEEQAIDSLVEQRRLCTDAIQGTINDIGEVKGELDTAKKMLAGDGFDSKDRIDCRKIIRDDEKDLYKYKIRQDKLLIDMVAIDSHIAAASQRLVGYQHDLDYANKAALKGQLVLDRYDLTGTGIESSALFSKLIPGLEIAISDVSSIGKTLQGHQSRKMAELMNFSPPQVVIPDPVSCSYGSSRQEDNEEWREQALKRFKDLQKDPLQGAYPINP